MHHHVVSHHWLLHSHGLHHLRLLTVRLHHWLWLLMRDYLGWSRFLRVHLNFFLLNFFDWGLTFISATHLLVGQERAGTDAAAHNDTNDSSNSSNLSFGDYLDIILHGPSSAFLDDALLLIWVALFSTDCFKESSWLVIFTTYSILDLALLFITLCNSDLFTRIKLVKFTIVFSLGLDAFAEFIKSLNILELILGLLLYGFRAFGICENLISNNANILVQSLGELIVLLL